MQITLAVSHRQSILTQAKQTLRTLQTYIRDHTYFIQNGTFDFLSTQSWAVFTIQNKKTHSYACTLYILTNPYILYYNNSKNCIKRRNSRFFKSPHCTTNCLQHVLSSGLGAIKCKSHAAQRALITCNMSCVMWYEMTAHLWSLTELKLHLF